MALAAGTRLGPYEITSLLGAGGMGEVYRARDTRLERTVAIKVLPAQFTSDPIQRQRFEREAKIVSSLNHAHICVLYDVGRQDGIDYLVMECLEGETLASRLEKGALPLAQALKFGVQMADALDRAHRSGVIHRDLKPSNIMITAGGAKLLDFGLAKPALPAGGLATLTAGLSTPLTEQETIVGTLPYMSPEQVEGKELDARSDIFSLGAVLYEMITGKRAFPGKSAYSVASAILEKEPAAIRAVKPEAPRALEHTVKKCLAKNVDERWQNAGDLASELKWIGEEGLPGSETGRVASAASGWRSRTGWLVAGTLLVMLIAAMASLWSASHKRQPAMYFHISVPFAANDLALSADGRTLAMVAYSAEASNYAVWTYEMGGRRTGALKGTQGASYPFWSPDGKYLGFFADGKLKKVDVSGGHVQELCDASNGRGGTWNADGVIVFSADSFGGLSRVSSAGGPVVEITKPDAARVETSHRWPVFLPDGKHFLYLAANFTGNEEKNAIFVGALNSQERRMLVSSSANAAYAEPGYLLYLRENVLVAQAFDRRNYVLSGEPHAVSDEVMYTRLVDRAVFSVWNGEALVTQTGRGASLSQMTWFDRNGKQMGTAGAPGAYGNVRVSPDQSRIALDQNAPDGRNIDVWIIEPKRAAPTRLTFDLSGHQTPIWSPDGKQIVYSWNRKLGNQIYSKNADGSGSEEEVVDLGVGIPVNAWDWSRDGKYLLIRRGNELWYLSWPERVAKPLVQAKWTVQNAQFSPDGQWMAYASNETGSMEVYVSRFPGANGKWQVSSAGGQEPRWRADGKELFYLSPEGKMMAAEVTAGAGFKASAPVVLFQTKRRQPVSSFAVFSYDVSGDGKRFLIATKVDEANAAPPSVVLNWVSDLEK